MGIKEEVIADWNKRKSLVGFPRSWYALENADEIHIVLADSYAAGCISSYCNSEAGQKLDERRIGVLTGCREVFIKAQPFITDKEGKRLLDLYLRMSAMVLADCGVLGASEEG